MKKDKPTKPKAASSRVKSREEEMLRNMRYRNRIIVFLGLSLVMAIVGLIRAPHVIDIYQAPDPRYGFRSEPGEVHPPYIYSFAHNIFLLLNTWPNDGQEDYKTNSSRLNAYLTPAYFKEVWDDADSRLASNELRGRTRIVTSADGAAYSDSAVKILGPDSWLVYLDLNVEERVDNKVVKDTNVRYPIRVVKRDISRANNPYRLALDGFQSTPVRLNYEEKTSAVN